MTTGFQGESLEIIVGGTKSGKLKEPRPMATVPAPTSPMSDFDRRGHHYWGRIK